MIDEKSLISAMPVEEFLDRLRMLDVRLWLEGEQLRCSAPPGVLSPDLRDELRARRDELRETLGGAAVRVGATAPALGHDSVAPLASAQERVWFFHQLEPDSSTYNMSAVLTLTGPLDVAALERSVSAIVERHEILRTTFPERNGEPRQHVHAATPVRLRIEDLTAEPLDDRGAAAEAVWKREAERPFDLGTDHPLRTLLIRVGAAEHHLLITMHHIASDGASLVIFMRELVAQYKAARTGEPAAVPVLPMQYADYARGQRRWLESPDADKSLAYWMGQFAGELPVLELPTDHLRPAVQTFRGTIAAATIPPETAALVRNLSRRHGCTLFMTLLATFKTLLYRYTGEDDIVVGAPMASRDRQETRDLIGMFINTLALRTDLSGNPSFEELLGRVRNTCLKAFANQELPFARLLEALRPQRDLSRSPLFQVMFNMFTLDADDVAYVEGLTVKPPPMDRLLATHDGQSKFDLTMYARDDAEGIHLFLVYNADLFSAARMDAFLAHFQEMVRAIAHAPQTPVGDIPLERAASPARRVGHALREAPFQPLAPDFVESTIADRFAAVVARQPHAPAIFTEDSRLTYGELAAFASRLADAVDIAAAGAATQVALLSDHGAPMVASILGVLQQGSAYVPLDPAFPEERLAFLLDDARVTVLLVDPKYVELAERIARGTRAIVRTDARPAAHERRGRPSPDGLAYVLYTSGSSGKPKGISQNQRNVLHYVRAYANAIELTPADRLTLVASYTFDASVVDIFSALLNGAALYPVQLRSAGLHGIARLVEEQRITVYHSTPTLYRALSAHLPPQAAATVRAVVLGGEKVYPQDFTIFQEHFPPRSVFVNLYGASEVTIASMMLLDREAPAPGHAVPIGEPVEETELILLDAAGRPTAVRGEIAVKSRFLALGYWNAPELTQGAFSGDASARMYRTGDLGRRAPDGAIEFLGRKDFQVKIRGLRIEPGEIETVLGQHPRVAQNAVSADTSGQGDPILIGFVVLDSPGSATAAELKDYLRRSVPEYMVPTALVILDALPLTRTGKIDRRALPTARALGLTDRKEYVAPRNAIEELLAEVWAEVLRLSDIGVHDNFFALGGNSLNATQVVARLRMVSGVDLALRSLFSAPTIEGLAKAIQDTRPDGQIAEPALVRRETNGDTPLSYSQERMWFLQQLMPEGTAYNMIAAITLSGSLDRDAFVASLEEVGRRHDILRTTFYAPSGDPVQRVHDSMPVIVIERDFTNLPNDERLPAAKRLATELASRPFDLERGPLWWTLIAKVADNVHAVVFGFHHIVGDMWSFGVFGHELSRLYAARVRGDGAQLPSVDVQYGDFAVWQREWLAQGRLEEQLAYWKPQLGRLAPLELPTDRPRPPQMTPNGDRKGIEISPALVQRVRALSVREGVTPFMTFFTAFNVLLQRYSGQSDLAVGVPIANRTHVGVEALIGTFVNTLVHRNDLSGNPSFREALRRVRGVALDAFAHQDLPFERLVRELAPDRDVSRSPVFQVMFNMANAPARAVDMPGLSMELLDIERRAAQFDLSCIVRVADRSGIALSYNTDLFDGETIDRFLASYVTLLEAAMREPDQSIGRLAIMSRDARRDLLVARNETAVEFPNEPLPSLVAAQAKRTPGAVALEADGASLTYTDLDARANRVARFLRRRGVPVGALVGVCLNRSAETVVALLGVLKAGCAYIPIDPAYPPHRVQFMLEDSHASAVITESALAGRLPSTNASMILLDKDRDAIARESADDLEIAPTMDSLAYILYTSGSTGNPKGVQIPHSALVNFLSSMRHTPGLRAGDSLLAVTTISFDIAGLELYLPLVCGATIALVSREVASDGRRLHELLVRRQPTVMQATPATWRALLDAGWRAGETPGLKVFCGGEALPRDLADELLVRAAEVWNLYGPTETTIWSTVHRVTVGGASVPIGRPIDNTRVYVLDANGEPTPVGVPGELYIGGAGVARGYLNRPELTTERFVDDPFTGTGRMYRTGDRARFRPDGLLEHLGRLDQQVKLRGFRIELGEIEAALATLPAMSQVVVDVRQERLVAYVVFAKGQEMTASEIRAELRETLPDYMVPSLVVALEQLPLTPNGKVDRKALPDPLRTAGRAESGYLPPTTPAELVIADIWREVLGVERVSTNDNFFELGGHSLLSMRAVHEIQQRTGWRPDPRLLFFETLGKIASAKPAPSPS